MVRAADERSGLDVMETHFVASLAKFFEFGGSDISHDGEMLRGRAQVLAYGQNIYAMRAEVAHDRYHFVHGFAEA